MRMELSEIYQLMDGFPPGAWVAISTESDASCPTRTTR